MTLDVEWQRRECKWRNLQGGKLLREALDERGRGSQTELAELVEVRPQTVYAWLIGFRRPPKDLWPTLRRLYKIPVSAWQVESERARDEKRRAARLARVGAFEGTK